MSRLQFRRVQPLSRSLVPERASDCYAALHWQKLQRRRRRRRHRSWWRRGPWSNLIETVSAYRSRDDANVFDWRTKDSLGWLRTRRIVTSGIGGRERLSQKDGGRNATPIGQQPRPLPLGPQEHIRNSRWKNGRFRG